MTETWHIGTNMRVLGKSYPMNTNMTGFRWHTLHLIDTNTSRYFNNRGYFEKSQPLQCWWLIWPIRNDANIKERLKPWHIGTCVRVLNKSYPMNTDMTGFRWFQMVLFMIAAFFTEKSKWQMRYIFVRHYLLTVHVCAVHKRVPRER